MNTDRRLMALLISVGSAALGYALLWLVLEGGKIIFGKKRIRLEKPTAFTWTRQGDDADFVVGDEKSLWSDYLRPREGPTLIALFERQDRRSSAIYDMILRFHYNRVQIGSDNLSSIISMKSAEQLTRSRFRAKPWVEAI